MTQPNKPMVPTATNPLTEYSPTSLAAHRQAVGQTQHGLMTTHHHNCPDLAGVRERLRRSGWFGTPPLVSTIVFLGLSFALLGDLSVFFGSVALVWLFVSGVTAIVALLMAIVSVVQGSFRHAVRMMVVVVGAVVMLPATTRVVFDTPYCVKRKARPAIEAVVQYAGHGPYPRNDPELMVFPGEPALPENVAAVIHATGCSYLGFNDPATFHITCNGVGFSHHTYDHRSGRWSTWD